MNLNDIPLVSHPCPCMGGFCSSRDHCANYHSERLQAPSERLCGEKEEPELMRESPQRMAL